jgi:hypothetical protein
MSIAILAIPVFCSLISEPWHPRDERQITDALIDSRVRRPAHVTADP